MKRILIFVIVLPVASSAWSQDADPCKTQRNTIEINQCASSTLAQRDKELNAAYQALMKALVPSDKTDATDYQEVRKHLLEGQRNWVRFIDSDCKAKYTLNEGGTIRDVVHLGCLTEHTEQRTRQLLDWTQE